MWRCINRITMEPFSFALFLMEISYPDTPARCCLATDMANKGKARQCTTRRVSVSGDVTPEAGTVTVLALPSRGCREQPGSSSIHQTPKENSPGPADWDKVLHPAAT